NKYSTLNARKTFPNWDSCESFLQNQNYDSNSNKDTGSKKTEYPFLVNASCPKSNNPEVLVFINKFGVTAQRKFLENKYPLHSIYLKDLYAAINKFHPTYKSLSNDVAQVSNWLDCQKEQDSQYKLLEATSVHPSIILTDADLAVDSAVHQIFPFTYPIYYAYYITQNLHKNLRKVLGDDYQKFLDSFYLCCYSLVEDNFQKRYEKLKEDYSNT
ncbi:1101_t:CDS:2, partial [Scutellospora calospora]